MTQTKLWVATSNEDGYWKYRGEPVIPGHVYEFQGVPDQKRYRPATLEDAYSTTHWLDKQPTAGTAGGFPAPPAGRKDDGGKLDYTLLDDMPNALAAVVEVMQWAVTKKEPVPYERGSWQGVEPDRYRAAILRHNAGATAQAIGSDVPARQQRDEETGLLHLAHQATSALMALESTLRELKRA